MKITRNQFIEAIGKYFTDEMEKSKGSPYGTHCRLLVRELNLLIIVQREARKSRERVHLGHTFGPFGFKVD